MAAGEAIEGFELRERLKAHKQRNASAQETIRLRRKERAMVIEAIAALSLSAAGLEAARQLGAAARAVLGGAAAGVLLRIAPLRAIVGDRHGWQKGRERAQTQGGDRISNSTAHQSTSLLENLLSHWTAPAPFRAPRAGKWFTLRTMNAT